MTFLICAGFMAFVGILIALVPEDRRVVPVDPDFAESADFKARQAAFFSDGFYWRWTIMTLELIVMAVAVVVCARTRVRPVPIKQHIRICPVGPSYN